MKTARNFALIIVLLSSITAGAQWWSGTDQLPDEPWRKGKGDFGAMLLLTHDVEKFYDDWQKPKTPAITSTDTAERGKPITAVILFTGCRASDAKCDVRVDFTVLKPDGSECASMLDVAAWKDKPAPPRGAIQVSEASLGMIIEPNDPAGKYIVRAVVRDVKAEISLTVEESFTVR